MVQFTKEIMQIAAANGVTFDIGINMFIANIEGAKLGNMPRYAGAAVDYGALVPRLDELRGTTDALNQLHTAHYDQVTKIYNEQGAEAAADYLAAQAG